MPFSLGFWAAAGAGGGGGADAYELISTTLLGSDTTSVTFSSIASTYKHLQLRITTKLATAGGTGGFNLDMRMNGITTSSYSYHNLLGNGSSVSAGNGASQSSMRFARAIPSASHASGVYSATVIDILDYANTNKYKTVRTLSGYVGSSFGAVLGSGMLQDTSAISSITFLDVDYSTGFKSGSRFSLYGIKG
jgi:hypothetical protein